MGGECWGPRPRARGEGRGLYFSGAVTSGSVWHLLPGDLVQTSNSPSKRVLLSPFCKQRN